MKKKKISQIQKQYRYEKEANAYLIEVSLDDYDDIYNDWDPSPFKRRFIEVEFNEFILSSAEDIPLKYKLIIDLYLPANIKEPEKEKAVLMAYENYYLYAIEKEERSCANLRKKNVFYFIGSMVLLGLGYFYLNASDNILLKVIREGVFIGGWVFLWEFITNISITRREFRSRLKLYKRIYLSEIRFVYR